MRSLLHQHLCQLQQQVLQRHLQRCGHQQRQRERHGDRDERELADRHRPNPLDGLVKGRRVGDRTDLRRLEDRFGADRLTVDPAPVHEPPLPADQCRVGAERASSLPAQQRGQAKERQPEQQRPARGEKGDRLPAPMAAPRRATAARRGSAPRAAHVARALLHQCAQPACSVSRPLVRPAARTAASRRARAGRREAPPPCGRTHGWPVGRRRTRRCVQRWARAARATVDRSGEASRRHHGDMTMRRRRRRAVRSPVRAAAAGPSGLLSVPVPAWATASRVHMTPLVTPADVPAGPPARGRRRAWRAGAGCRAGGCPRARAPCRRR